MPDGLKVALKILIGIIFMPAAILMHWYWDDWASGEMAAWKRLVLAPFLLIAFVICLPLADWWNDL